MNQGAAMVFRNRSYLPLGVSFSAAATAIGVVVVLTADDAGWIVVLAAGLWSTVAAWFFSRLYLHPRILVTETGVTVVNPFAAHTFGWEAIRSVTADHFLRIELHDGHTIAAWAVQAANLSRLLGRESAADRVASEIAAARPPGASEREFDQPEYQPPSSARIRAVVIVLGIAAVVAARIYSGWT